jgi:hypothetical protein
MLSPAIDPPGVWSGELSIKGVPVLTLSLAYFTPCDYPKFCETEGKIVDKQLLQTLVPPSATCNPNYCLDVANLVDPSIVSFFPSEGPSTGGTIVSVLARNLPAFSASDLSIEGDLIPLTASADMPVNSTPKKTRNFNLLSSSQLEVLRRNSQFQPTRFFKILARPQYHVAANLPSRCHRCLAENLGSYLRHR